MATWAIGDVQGCYEPLRRLVEAAGVEAGRDRLWFVGDLVNRGPQSAEVLRWIRGLGASAVAVLGNHDLHLLGVAHGVRSPKKGDTGHEVLDAPDAEELLAWLSGRPLVHSERGYLLVHAGLLPQWTADQALRLAAEIEEQLCGPRAKEVLAAGRKAPDWSPSLRGMPRWTSGLAALTRLRVCDEHGRQLSRFKAAPEECPDGYWPWFDAPGRKWTDHRVVFGHWAAGGVRVRPDVIATDSGCVWGNHLTAVCLDNDKVVSVPA